MWKKENRDVDTIEVCLKQAKEENPTKWVGDRARLLFGIRALPGVRSECVEAALRVEKKRRKRAGLVLYDHVVEGQFHKEDKAAVKPHVRLLARLNL